MSAPLSVLTWKWTPPTGYRSKFGPETVNTLFAMVRRWYPSPIRAMCITDDPTGIDPSVEVVPIWNDFADLKSPHGSPRNPSCYRRLRMFHPDAAQWFGPRFVSLDLDMVITGSLQPLFDRTEPIVLYGDTNPRPGSHYNGSMILMTAGCRSRVWTEFDPLTSPQRALRADCFGSDQAWISYRLGPGEAKFGTDDGVYSYRKHLRQGQPLPSDARVVVMHGHVDPWDATGQRIPWVRKHYRAGVAA